MKKDDVARVAGILCLAAGLCGITSARAQNYPVKPIKIIVPFPPGGPNDLLGRTVGQKLSEQMGQPVIIENRSGAAGNIGSHYVAASPPDGYTLLNGASALTIAPALTKNLPFDVSRDFAPIEFSALIKAELSKFARLVREAHIKSE